MSLAVLGLRICCQCRGHGFDPCSGKIPHAIVQLTPRATATDVRAAEPVLCNKGCLSRQETHGVWIFHLRRILFLLGDLYYQKNCGQFLFLISSIRNLGSFVWRVSICLLGLQNLKCLLILYRKEFFDSCPRILPYLPQVKLSSKVWLLEKTVGTSLSSHTTELHLHEVSKAVKFIEAES